MGGPNLVISPEETKNIEALYAPAKPKGIAISPEAPVIQELHDADVKKVAQAVVPVPESPKEIFTQPYIGGKPMSWWTETRDSLAQNLGLDTPANVVTTVGNAVKNEIKQSQPVYVAPAQGTAPAMAQASVQAAVQSPAAKYLLVGVIAYFAIKLFSKKR